MTNVPVFLWGKGRASVEACASEHGYVELCGFNELPPMRPRPGVAQAAPIKGTASGKDQRECDVLTRILTLYRGKCVQRVRQLNGNRRRSKV